MSRAVLSVGSNMGERLHHMQGAVDAVRPWLCAVSPVYETAPWGPVDQDEFLNAVLIVDDPGASAGDWLARAQAAEQAAHRRRTRHWGPRTLDVDVITVDDLVSDDPVLLLPHPRAAQRAFVLVPWSAADVSATLSGVPVRELLDALPPDERAGVRERADLVLR